MAIAGGMVLLDGHNSPSSVARVSVVDINGDIKLDIAIQQFSSVVDYRTEVTGLWGGNYRNPPGVS